MIIQQFINYYKTTMASKINFPMFYLNCFYNSLTYVPASAFCIFLFITLVTIVHILFYDIKIKP